MLNKITIDKNLLIASSFILLLLFAVNINIDSIHAVDLNETGNHTSSAINKGNVLGNSQTNGRLQATKQLDGGTFSDIQNKIHNELNEGDTLILNGVFTTNEPESHIIVYKNITFKSTSGATLNANNVSSIFVVEMGGSGSSFSNLVLKNGYGRQGGAIMIHGQSVSIQNCEFDNNYAYEGGGAVYTNYQIETNPDYGRDLLIKDCTFNYNSARTASGAVGAYGFNTRILNCTFFSNSVYDKYGDYVYGGAMQVGRKEYISNSVIKDCKFINNSAISISKEIYSHGGASCIRDGVTYENCLFEGNSADRGGALTTHCSANIKNCTFISNSATDFGGALYSDKDSTSINLKVMDCDFESNTAAYGGAIKLDGNQITIENCNINSNHASVDGGAVYINSKILNIYVSDFIDNDAQHNGGAIYVNGMSTTVQDSYFKSNVAIADPEVNDDGLGGAIYINGTSDQIKNNVFEYNVARNGSAIYYDKCGEDLTIANNEMHQNQAWVYALPVYARDIYYGENENIGAIIYGGNNIGDYDNLLVSNSIYNAALSRNIKVNGETPVSGATSSGRVYQDSREYNIDVLLTVKHSDGTVVYNRTLKSSYLGEVKDVLSNLKPGTYTLIATHYEDNYYKAIRNSTTFVVKPKIDVKVSKNSQNSEYNYHDLIVWTINVVNNGPNDATNVNVTDVLPNGLVYRSHILSKGVYSNGVWNIGDLSIGDSAYLKITTLIDKTGVIINEANVTATEFDWNMTNNRDSNKITVNNASDLAITKISNVTSPNYGDLVKWTLKVTNNGPDIAHNVTVTDNLPSGLVLKSPSGEYSSGKWLIGTLGVGQSRSLEIITLVNKTGDIKNTASVTASEHDYDLSNNVASKTISVAKACDLQVSKSVNNSTPNYSKFVKWTITVRNNGPDAATGVNVTDILPAGLVYKSSSASKGSYANGIWTVDALDKGSSASLNIVCLVNKTGNIRNVVSVVGNEYDYDLSNNNAAKTINVPNAADLEVVKTVNETNPKYLKLVDWTITVKNNGPDDANGVNVDDILPEGLIIQSTTGNYSNGKFYIGFLKAFSSTTIKITTLINKTGVLVNNVSVYGREYDYDMSNNKANKAINVSKSADLKISKIVSNPTPDYKSDIKWIILVENCGPDKATDVKVNEVLGEEFELIRSSPSKGYYINDIWTIGELDIGEKVNLEIITKINRTGNFTNIVNVSGNEYDHNISNNEANKSIFVNPAIDLEVTKKVNNTSPNYNGLVKWTVTVRNNGPDNANNIEMHDILPENLKFSSYNATKGFYEDGLWKFCCLEVGEVAKLEVITRVLGIGEIKNVVVASAKEYDYNPDNNRAEAVINVAPACDLQMTKLVNQSTINYKELVKWTLIVKNNGPSDATRVVVFDTLPKCLSYVSSSGDGTFSTTGTWYVGDISCGESKQITIITRADATGEFDNVAVVSGEQHDYNPSNNRDEKSLFVKPAADLAITKTVSKAISSVGDLITYSIELTNNGPDTAQNIRVDEIMDDSLILESFLLASGEYDTQNHVWNIKSLGSNEKTFLKINAVSTKEGSFANRVSTISDTFDFNLNNNVAEVIVEIIKKAIDPKNPFNSGLYSKLHDFGLIKKNLNLVSKAKIEMKETGIPVGLLIFISLISIVFCNSNISKKR
ncbi:MAG: DUF11 domain-containing protein [Methanobrevibacter sp.]|nr:DUF11 domain-containing protein [Methanobrevibacter sp.]